MERQEVLNEIYQKIESVQQEIETAQQEIAKKQTILRKILLDYINELLEGVSGGFIVFEDDSDLMYPQFVEEDDWYSSRDIFGVKITIKKNVPKLLIYTDIEEDFENNKRWFDPYIYGDIDEYELFKFIKENENNLIIKN